VTGVAVGVSPPHALKSVDSTSKSAGATSVFRRNIFVSFLRMTFNLWIATPFLLEQGNEDKLGWSGEPDLYGCVFLLNLI
jgi:hypothetical protein